MVSFYHRKRRKQPVDRSTSSSVRLSALAELCQKEYDENDTVSNCVDNMFNGHAANVYWQLIY